MAWTADREVGGPNPREGGEASLLQGKTLCGVWCGGEGKCYVCSIGFGGIPGMGPLQLHLTIAGRKRE